MAEPSDEATSAGSTDGPAETADQCVSVAAELAHIAKAVDAAALLTEALAQEALSSEEAKALAPGALGAVLDLIQIRLAQVGRVIRGAEDPAKLLTRFNGAPPWTAGEDPDLRLQRWTPAQRAAHHAQQQAAAERDEELAQREKPTPRQEE